MSLKMSENIDKLATALCKFQTIIEPVKKDSPSHYGKYANLETVIATVKKPLSDQGLSYSQLPTSTEAGNGVTTILMHNSGQYISNDFTFPVVSVPSVGKNCQAQGIILSYYRRYALLGALGLSQTDDDGQTAVDVYDPPKNIPKQKREALDLKKVLYSKIQAKGLSETQACELMEGINSYKDLKGTYDYKTIESFISKF